MIKQHKTQRNEKKYKDNKNPKKKKCTNKIDTQTHKLKDNKSIIMIFIMFYMYVMIIVCCFFFLKTKRRLFRLQEKDPIFHFCDQLSFNNKLRCIYFCCLIEFYIVLN